MSEAVIRPARTDDIPALAELERECFSLPWSENAFREFMQEANAVVLAATVDENLAGYLAMSLALGDDDLLSIGEIANVAVTQKFRRRGIGSALLMAAANHPGMKLLQLEVRESNTPARAMYERLGFKVDGVRRGFYTKPREDAILMSLKAHEL